MKEFSDFFWSSLSINTLTVGYDVNWRMDINISMADIFIKSIFLMSNFSCCFKKSLYTSFTDLYMLPVISSSSIFSVGVKMLKVSAKTEIKESASY